MEAETQTGPTESLSVEICLQRPADVSLASASRGAPGQLNIGTESSFIIPCSRIVSIELHSIYRISSIG